MGAPHFDWSEHREAAHSERLFDRADRLTAIGLVTVTEFAEIARLSRRQIDRLRKRRPEGFPRELELGTGASKHRSCPRFRLSDVQRWVDSRALW